MNAGRWHRAGAALQALRHSLRWRLVVSLMLAIGLFWSLWFFRQMQMMSSQQTGLWDISMRATARQIMLSLPQGVSQGIGDLDNTGYLKLPPRLLKQPDDTLKQGEAYQIWRRDGRLLLRSVDTPEQPWAPLRWDEEDHFSWAEIDGERWRVYAVQDTDGQVQVQIGLSQAHMDEAFAIWLHHSLWVALMLMLLLAGVVWAVVCRSLRAVSGLGLALSRRPPLDVQPLPTQGLPEEVRPLVDGVNVLLARLDTALQSERRFIADAAHELRTPLAALMTQAQLAQSAESLEQCRTALVPLAAGIQRSSRMTEQLLDTARVDASSDHHSRQAPVPLHEVTAMLVHDFGATAQAGGQRVALHTEPCLVRADVDAIGVLLRNLLDNALRYSGPGSRIEVSCLPLARGTTRRIALSVRDNGRGVPEAELARLTDRFYRVPGTAGNGSGIGLSLVARIAQLHGAELDIGPGPSGQGLNVTLWFTEADAGQGPTAEPALELSPNPLP